ncbi:MAG: hypothetical protein MK089_01810 [Phycisphaerales bacterium]|nr:hypothetical protein [Phycisphaerales bacterium]
MTPPASQHEHPLWRHTGSAILSASEAILKASLEVLPNVQRVIYVASQATADLDQIKSDPETAELLRMHRLQLERVADASRAMLLASWAARQGEHVVAILTGPTLAGAIELIESSTRPLSSGGALALVVEDLGLNRAAMDIRGRMARQDIPVLEAHDVPHLRDSIENGLRISSSYKGIAGIVVDRSILRCSETVHLRPNRGDQMDADDPLRSRRRRRPRWKESGGPLRMTRRLELNAWRSMPSPGEAVSWGFITVGPADRILQHLASILGITGRLPVLQLGVLHPLDHAAVGRILKRCRNVIILEPRPGTVEDGIRRISEKIRIEGGNPALIWGQQLPPDDEGHAYVLEGRETLHPSSLMRRLLHVLRDVVGSQVLHADLQADPEALPVPVLKDRFGAAGQHEAVRRLAQSLPELLESPQDDEPADESVEEEDSPATDQTPVRLCIDGEVHGPQDGRPVYVETFSGPGFLRHGSSAVRQAAESSDTWIFLVAQPHGSTRPDLERQARAAIPASRSERVHVRRGTLAETSRLRRMIREAVQERGLVVLIIDDGPPVRFDVGVIEKELSDIDALGFQPVQRIVWPADRACVIRQPPMLAEREVEAVRHAAALETRSSREDVQLRWPPRLGGRIRLLVEQVEVHRNRPPIRELSGNSGGLQVPTPVHADSASWSVHLAGLRGPSVGLAARALMLAGSAMNYHVQARSVPTPIGAGRRAWSQISFSRPRSDTEASRISPVIPWGEADLLLGLDRVEALLSVSPDELLRVAGSRRTYGVVNVGLFEDQQDREVASQDVKEIAEHFRNLLHPDGQVIEDFTDLCRWRFLNERLADLVQLGTAFQLGAVPVTTDAIESALLELEAQGFARSLEAFKLGRQFARNPGRLRRPGEDPDAETASRFIRRQCLPIGRTGLGSRERANRFRRLTQRVFYDLPGLTQNEEAADSYRDFTVALRRCITWGGFDYAERFADAIVALYRCDMPERGYALTRKAILPLAEASLTRDSIFLASMAVSSEHRLLTRHRLNVHRARGDRVEVRYLTRLELTFIRWRFRLDLRTSDWMARGLSAVRHLLPTAWRGTRRDRQVRRLVQELLLRAGTGAAIDYDGWLEVMTELNELALDGRLRRIHPDRLREMLERRGAHES